MIIMIGRANEQVYSAAISACEKGRQWERALQLLGVIDYPQN